MTRPHTGTILIASAAALTLLAGGATAGATIAAGPIDGSGVIHGCWTNAAINGTHVFVLQDAGTICPKGTTAISWNQQGPAGPAGPAGLAGATGPVGPAGLTGPAGPRGDTGAQGPAGTTGPAGPVGTTGPAGPAGSNGNTILNGAGAPAASLGNDGDFYLDTAADVLYGPKAGGTWPAVGTSLTGAAGPQGPAGAVGPAGLSTAGPGGLDLTRVVHTDPNVEPGVLVWAVCTRDHPYLVSGGASLPPATGTAVLTESAPINAVLSGAAAAGDQVINITGDVQAFAARMPVSIDSGTSQETGVVALGPGSPSSTGGQGGPTGSGIELSSPLSNAHAAGAVITGQGWQAQVTGNAALTVWALCAK